MKKTLILLAFLAAACSAPVHETLVTDPADYAVAVAISLSEFGQFLLSRTSPFPMATHLYPKLGWERCRS